MNGVDKSDQNIGYYAPRRKSLKWYIKLAIYFISLARFQAYIIYKKTNANPVGQLQFIHELVVSLIERADIHAMPRGRTCGVPLQRLTDRHFPSFIPPTERKEKPSRRCIVCCVPTGQRRQRGVPAPRRHETRYMCDSCGVALCVVPCFRLYHTYTDYKQAYRQQIDDE